jgi:amino acid transporter
MAETGSTPTPSKATLGLTGLTSNAMALIAPGAFLWLTFSEQSAYGAPSASSAMWLGIVFALLLCLATAVAYAELSKLYPGAGSSYFFAEQAFLSKKQAFKWARIYKFMVGWASHLYYWVYPGVMVCVTCIFVGYMAGQLFPNTFSTAIASPLLMVVFAVIFSYGVSYIAYRGVVGATGVNVAINVIQITALLIFSTMAITHRVHVHEGDPAWTLDSTNTPTMFVQDTTPNMVQDPKFPNDPTKQIPDPAGTTSPKVDGSGAPVWVYTAVDAKGAVINDASGNPVIVATDATGKLAALPAGAAKAAPELNTISYKGGMVQDSKGVWQFTYHESAISVLHWHKGSFVFIQACVAILILVGFESVTAMGEEAKNPKKDIGRAVLLSLVIQGAVCYLIEYFAANYLLHNGYTLPQASGSGAPIGDMMVIVGTWLFGSYSAGRAFMLVQAFTVFLALIGTTLACLSTGARVTYAMGRDEEVPSHFGLLHGKTLSPHRSIWVLSVISIVIGIITVSVYLGGTTPAALDKHNVWYSFGIFAPETYAKLPNTLLIVTLVSNFGTFLLYMTTCIVAIVAFREHHMFNGFKHMLVPLFGLVANFACMLFYLIGPWSVPGMSVKEPYIALGVAAVWGIYGLVYFRASSKARGKEMILTAKPAV